MKVLLRSLLVLGAFATSEVAFAETAAKVLGEAQLRTIVQSVTADVAAQQSKALGRQVKFTDAYVNRVVKLLGSVEMMELTAPAARWRVIGLYGVFATHAVAFAGSQTQQGVITLTGPLVDGYLESSQRSKRCGEAPCNMSCQPCDSSCNRC